MRCPTKTCGSEAIFLLARSWAATSTMISGTICFKLRSRCPKLRRTRLPEIGVLRSRFASERRAIQPGGRYDDPVFGFQLVQQRPRVACGEEDHGSVSDEGLQQLGEAIRGERLLGENADFACECTPSRLRKKSRFRKNGHGTGSIPK